MSACLVSLVHCYKNQLLEQPADRPKRSLKNSLLESSDLKLFIKFHTSVSVLNLLRRLSVPPLFNRTLYICLSVCRLSFSLSPNTLCLFTLCLLPTISLSSKTLSIFLTMSSISLSLPLVSHILKLCLSPSAASILRCQLSPSLYLFVFTVPFSLFSSSFYVRHSMSAILCLFFYVCYHMSVILCLPFYVSHSMSVILCLPFYVCHPMYLCHHMSAILCLPSMSVILCLPSLGPPCLRSPLCRPYPSPRLPCALQQCRYL